MLLSHLSISVCLIMLIYLIVLNQKFHVVQTNFIIESSFGYNNLRVFVYNLTRIAKCQEKTSFRCGNGQCIPLERRCNGAIDCYAGDDEDDCRKIITLHTIPSFITNSFCLEKRSRNQSRLALPYVYYLHTTAIIAHCGLSLDLKKKLKRGLLNIEIKSIRILKAIKIIEFK